MYGPKYKPKNMPINDIPKISYEQLERDRITNEELAKVNFIDVYHYLCRPIIDDNILQQKIRIMKNSRSSQYNLESYDNILLRTAIRIQHAEAINLLKNEIVDIDIMIRRKRRVRRDRKYYTPPSSPGISDFSTLPSDLDTFDDLETDGSF